MDDRTEALLKAAADNGWDFFKQILEGPQPRASQLSQAQADRAQQLCQDAATVFGTAAGERLLQWLMEVTLHRATFVAQVGLPMDQAYGHGCLREGQNGIVFTLLKMIAEGRKEQPPMERDYAPDPTAQVLAASVAATGNRKRRRRR